MVSVLFSTVFFILKKKTFKKNYKYASASDERCQIHFCQVDELKTQSYKIFSGTDTQTKERLPLFEIDDWGKIQESVKRTVDGHFCDGTHSFSFTSYVFFH